MKRVTKQRKWCVQVESGCWAWLGRVEPWLTDVGACLTSKLSQGPFIQITNMMICEYARLESVYQNFPLKRANLFRVIHLQHSSGKFDRVSPRLLQPR